jgi:FimV-like protein
MPLACGSVSGQESGAQAATSFELKGVLISSFTRTALVDGKLVEEGDLLSGVKILAIDQDGVRVLAGAREFTVDVGGTFVGHRSSNDVTGFARTGTHLRHAVKPGETLSGIALQHLRDGVTMDQMMIALFNTNRQAFDGNINALRAGAVLRIPGRNELRHQAPEIATAEVLRQTDMWKAERNPKIQLANSSTNERYGPVRSGETLSAIATKLLHDGATMNQMMIALFRANPQAFSNNIHRLLEGGVLRVPDGNELRRQTPAMATAEVVRQTNAWQTGYEQHAPLNLAQANVVASSHELIH